MAIVLRAEKGSALTIAEFDGNFTDLDGRLMDLESSGGGGGGGVGIESASISGAILSLHLTDGSITSVELPLASSASSITAVETVTGTTYEISAETNSRYHRCTNAAGCTVSLPTSGGIL